MQSFRSSRRIYMANTSKKTDTGKISKRDLILETALEVFANNGYGSTRLDDIAKKAGLSYGLAYYYFNSKDTLFHATVQNMILKMPGIIPADQSNGMDAYERLVLYTDTFFKWLQTPEGRYSVILMDHILVLDDIPELSKISMQEKNKLVNQDLYALFAELESMGCTNSQDPAKLVRLYQAMFSGFSFNYIASRDPRILDTDFLLSALNISRPTV